MAIRGAPVVAKPPGDDYYPEFDADDYVSGIRAEIDDILGPDPEIRLAVLEGEICTVVSGMLWAYGVDGVETASKRIRETVDVAERNALMSNGPHDYIEP